MTTTVAKPSRVTWVRRNLFRTPLDGILTIVFGSLGLYVIFRGVLFVASGFVNGRWQIIDDNLKLLMVGLWPVQNLIRIGVSVAVLALWAGVIGGVIAGRQKRRGTSSIEGLTAMQRASDLTRRFGLVTATLLLLLSLTDTAGPWIMVLSAFVAGVIGRVIGGWIGVRFLPIWVSRLFTVVMVAVPIGVFLYLTSPWLPDPLPTARSSEPSAWPLAEWEGFMFNLTSAAAGIVLSFPIGLLLALGRRSKLRLLQGISIVYIEFVRGAPLYVLLLMANVSLEFFVPEALAPSRVVRAIVTFTLFTAAYIAEIVRGGLQSVPVGQEEAGKALGLTPTKQMRLIVLPQALRNVIPAQIGQFISLFKDTTLAGLALGILDLLAGATAITQQPDFRGQGLIIEALVFVGFLFWVGSFTMSRESQRLEKKLGVGTR